MTKTTTGSTSSTTTTITRTGVSGACAGAAHPRAVRQQSPPPRTRAEAPLHTTTTATTTATTITTGRPSSDPAERKGVYYYKYEVTLAHSYALSPSLRFRGTGAYRETLIKCTHQSKLLMDTDNDLIFCVHKQYFML
ncbi:hypothetical protein AVEN_42042-1 [Araneus ventricosus]|uniref:Uncharacterized protein n=1 Tax=Araneus ventricosus TaxID=182803 RepID=A0A4Y2GHL2_ARAVE|nr:hypothetical protein AVEN_42042-1 [Araneus ventricosus]